MVQYHEPNKIKAVNEIVTRSIQIANFLSNGAKNSFENIDIDIKQKFTQEMVDRVCAARDILYECGDQIDSIFSYDKNIAINAVPAWKAGVEIHLSILPFFSDQANNRQTIDLYNRKIGKFDDYSKLESEIRTLQEQINNLETKEKDGWIKYIGIFIIIVGIIMGVSGSGLSAFVIIAGIIGLVIWYFENIQIRENQGISYSLNKDLATKKDQLRSKRGF